MVLTAMQSNGQVATASSAFAAGPDNLALSLSVGTGSPQNPQLRAEAARYMQKRTPSVLGRRRSRCCQGYCTLCNQPATACHSDSGQIAAGADTPNQMQYGHNAPPGMLPASGAELSAGIPYAAGGAGMGLGDLCSFCWQRACYMPGPLNAACVQSVCWQAGWACGQSWAAQRSHRST